MSTPASMNASQTMPPPKEMFTLENPVFCCYLFWATVLVAKMLLMSLLTAIQRFRYKVGHRWTKGHHYGHYHFHYIPFTAAGARSAGGAAQGTAQKPQVIMINLFILGLNNVCVCVVLFVDLPQRGGSVLQESGGAV